MKMKTSPCSVLLLLCCCFATSLVLKVNGSSQPPNVLLILVDELRFPQTVFPNNISSVEEYVSTFMPNVYNRLWTQGAVFGNHYTAAVACTPSRATLMTGLYTHQHYELATLTNFYFENGSIYLAPQPELNSNFPTLGKILRDLDYVTPYAGKWHCSDSPASPHDVGADIYLEKYGFDGFSIPDPIGYPGQGDGAFGQIGDEDIASTAINWLGNYTGSQPFALTASFVNPHDIQFFWGGVQVDMYNQLLETVNETAPKIFHEITTEDNVPSYGYPTPPNVESPEDWQAQGKPRLQYVFSEISQIQIGGTTYNASNLDEFYVAPSPANGKYKAIAPYTYWSKGLDTYTKVTQDMDDQIGRLLDALEADPERAANTIIVFTADHGEMAGSHGLRGKGGMAYEEAIKVPFIVYDPTGTYVTQPGVLREQLTSSIDIMPFLVTVANGNSDSWITSNRVYNQLYSNRFDLRPLLSSPDTAQGREYILSTTDESFKQSQNYLDAPIHVIAVVNSEGKLVVYTDWETGTSTIVTDPSRIDVEYYSWSTPQGVLELENTFNTSSVAQALYKELFSSIIPNELRAPLPIPYPAFQDLAIDAFWIYVEFLNHINEYTPM